MVEQNVRHDDRKIRTKEVRQKNNNQFLKLIVFITGSLCSHSLWFCCVCVCAHLKPLEYIFGYDSVLDIYYGHLNTLRYTKTDILTTLLTICGSKCFFIWWHAITQTQIHSRVREFIVPRARVSAYINKFLRM